MSRKFTNELIARAADALRLMHSSTPAGCIARVELELDFPNDLISWLHAQTDSPRLGYWRDRDDDSEIAAYGVCDVARAPSWSDLEIGVNGVTERLAHSNNSARYFGGLRFEAERGGDAVWDGWGGCEFALPACGIERDSQGTRFFTQAVGGSEKSLLAALHFLNSLAARCNAPEQTHALELSSQFSPAEEQWGRILNQTLAEIADGRMQKVVLARRAHISWSAGRSPHAVLCNLREKEPDCYIFAAFGSESVFLGASPELLYNKCGNSLRTEAVAGTTRASGTNAIDEKAASELQLSNKNVREHTIVKDWICEKLAPLSLGDPTPGVTAVRKLNSVQHLVTPISTELKSGVSNATLLRILHPTPAVAGRPREAALKWIAQHEPFERGWYAAPVGWISRDSAKFIVALRCAMLNHEKAWIYSGAGIVAGSDAEQEWAEVNNKTLSLRQAISQERS